VGLVTGESLSPSALSASARFLERVSQLLREDAYLIPARIMEVCRRVQIELLVAPAADLDAPRPAPAPRSPYHRP
jgi:hypothetical protein